MNNKSRALKMLAMVGVTPTNVSNVENDMNRSNIPLTLETLESVPDLKNDDYLLLQADEQIIRLRTLYGHPFDEIPVDDCENEELVNDNSQQPIMETQEPTIINTQEPDNDKEEYDANYSPEQEADTSVNFSESHIQMQSRTDSDCSDEEERREETREDEASEITVRSRKKRRQVDPLTWKRMKNNEDRQTGKEYYGKRKRGTEWDYNVPKGAKVLKARCKCNGKLAMKCNEISDEQRIQMFENFWKLSWNEKKILLTALVEKESIKRARDRKVENESRREFSYVYYLKTATRIRVCKTMFCNTFSIPARTVGRWIINKETNRNADQERNDQTEKQLDERKSKINEQKDNLASFFRTLPKLESHYCRKSTSKLYLEPNWQSKSKLYRYYLDDWCKKTKSLPLSIATFNNTFDDLNLALFSPKKDECDTCVSYKTKNVDEFTYQQHLIKKEEARQEKESDKMNENIKVFTMDLQSVLLSPKSNVSSLYYKTKLIVHNFTIFDIKTKDGFCFLWHEGEATLSANTFASIIYNFLQTKVLPERDSFEKIILYSDGCTGQNRNALLSTALLNLAQQTEVTIEQKYLEKGHTQMECDSMHSTIERKLRKKIINVPADYVEVCETARLNPKPYIVEYLDHTFFKNFQEVQSLASIRPGRTIGDPTVTDIRALQYTQNGIKYKISHSEEWKSLPCRFNKKKKAVWSYNDLPLMNSVPIPIKAEKFRHLMELKSSLKKDYHAFYDSLPHL